MEHGNDWLSAALVFLAAAVCIVPLAKRLGLGAILGYLVAGMLIGPWGLGLIGSPSAVLHVAEFGVVLMLFLVGLELEPRRLWAMRRTVFGDGLVQLLGSTLLILPLALGLGLNAPAALVAALALAMSSTAIGLAALAERNLLPSPAGQGVLGVMLFQDIAAIPVLALVPLLGAQAATQAGGGWAGALKALGLVALLVGGGRLLLPTALRMVARTRLPELFTAASLLLVVGAAALMRAADLSMALGAFLAGVLLAGSEYRRELETDLEPFKGLLLGLFFIAVGMSIDFAVLAAAPLTVLAWVLGFLLLKALLLAALARWRGFAPTERPFYVLLLAQGGEFGFVVVQTGQGAGALGGEAASVLLGAIALSMLLTPLLLAALARWWLPRLAPRAPAEGEHPDALREPQQAPVILAGFGRYGQIVGRLLSAQGLRATVLDHDPEQVQAVRRFGWEAFYGDATRLDLLRTAGAHEARVLVVAIDDAAQSEALVRLARTHFPQLQIVARARNVAHYAALHRLGVQHIQRETFESALRSAREVLEQIGLDAHEARRLADQFRRHNQAQLEQMLPHMGDEQALIALSKQGREQLEALWAAQRSEQQEAAARRRSGWRDPGP